MPEQTTETPAPSVQPATPGKVSKVNNLKNILTILAVILLIGAAPAAYVYRDKTAKSKEAKQQAEISTLQQKVAELEAKQNANSSQPAQETSTAPSTAVKENIIASIKSDNTAALEGYMASTVNVILAASEGIGDRTPEQAIADLEYLDNATDPWDFALPETTLTAYRNGSYAQYFPSNAVVGKSLNNYVVSFTFNSSGKINGIFMAANADLLQ